MNRICFVEKRMLEYCSIVSYVVLMLVITLSLILNFHLNDLTYIVVGSCKYNFNCLVINVKQ